MLCILLDVLLHIWYKGVIFVSEIKQNTNSTDPRRSLKSATKNYENTQRIQERRMDGR